jgi:RimJ/RimL family protein N-acetyltransferase
MLRLEGKNIYLRSLELDDADGNYPNWLNDPIVCKYNSHGDSLHTREMTLDYIKMVRELESYKVFAICDKQTNKHIGNISLQNISQKNKSAEFAILIGEQAFMGTGVGKEAGGIIINYAFSALKLHRIYCGTSQYNIPMQKLALKLNMQEEGISIDAMIKNEQYIDIYKYAIVNKK